MKNIDNSEYESQSFQQLKVVFLLFLAHKFMCTLNLAAGTL